MGCIQDYPAIHKTFTREGHNDRVQAGFEEMQEFREGLVDIGSHKRFGNNNSVDFISLRLAHVVLTHSRSLDGIQNTHFVVSCN